MVTWPGCGGSLPASSVSVENRADYGEAHRYSAAAAIPAIAAAAHGRRSLKVVVGSIHKKECMNGKCPYARCEFNQEM